MGKISWSEKLYYGIILAGVKKGGQMITVFLKIIVIFAIVAVGFAANKSGVLPFEANKYLVNLMLVITTPCMILSSMGAKDLTGETFTQTMETLGYSVLYFIFMSILNFIIVKAMRYKPVTDQGVIMVIMTALNTGFMGFPITKAIFGDDLFFLMVIQNIILTIYMYTLAIIQINYKNESKGGTLGMLKSTINFCTAAAVIGLILLFTGTRLPGAVEEFLSIVGDATVPVSMIIVGIQLAESDLKGIIKNKGLVFASIYSIFLVPVITFLCVNWLPITTPVKAVLIFASAFPCAVIVVGLASKENRNASLMAEGVALTTALSMISLPLVASFLLGYYNL